nr:hypothetical protein [Tanacetum cinerariifolium]
PPVVIREPESGKYQPLPEVPGKGKAKVSEEETGSDAGAQDEGQAGSNPDETSEGQAGPDPGDAGAKEQSIPSPMVHAGSDREHMDLDVADVSPQPSTEQLDEGHSRGFILPGIFGKSAQHQRYLAGETGSNPVSPAPKLTKPARKPKSTVPKAPPRPAVSTPATSAPPAPTSAPAKLQEKKRKQATKTFDKPPKAKKSKYGWVSKNRTLKNVEASKAEEVPAMEPQVAAEDTDLQK